MNPDRLAPWERRQFADAQARLHDTYEPVIAERDVSAVIADSMRRLPIPDDRRRLIEHLESWCNDRLSGLATSRQTVTAAVPSVVFVCQRNEARSQIAAGWARHLSGEAIAVRSAAIRPSLRIDPAIISAMTEVGITLDHEFPKPLTDEVLQGADVIVTLARTDRRRRHQRIRRETWPIDDPAHQAPDTVRLIRDDIRTRIEMLLATLPPLGPADIS